MQELVRCEWYAASDQLCSCDHVIVLAATPVRLGLTKCTAPGTCSSTGQPEEFSFDKVATFISSSTIFGTHLRRVIVSRWDRVSHAEKLFAFTSAQGAYLAEQLCTFARAISGKKYALINVHATVVAPSSVPKTHHVCSIVEACSLS